MAAQSPSSSDPNQGSSAHDRKAPTRQFRWQSLFQHVQEPLFVLNGKCRILFVNRAWEELTGVPAAEARGLACSRRHHDDAELRGRVAQTLWPPPETLAGKPARARRRVAFQTRGAPPWWDVEFFPLQGEQGLLCILAKINGSPLTPSVDFVPFPEALSALHGRLARKIPKDEAKKLWKPELLVALREEAAQSYRLDRLDSELPSMRRIADQVRLAGQVRAQVAVIGEPGSGKEWLARVIHRSSALHERAFAALDCARLPGEALADALFGAGGLGKRPGVGTIYLKNPHRLPHDLQARVLDWLGQEDSGAESLSPRVLAGFDIDPVQEMRAGRLLETLHAMLATIVINLPPLRERLADLPGLADYFFERVNAHAERRLAGLTPASMELLREYSWPGNLPELYSVLAGCHARASGERIDVADLPAYLRQAVRLEQSPAAPPDRPMPLDSLLEQAERRIIELALRRAHGNKSRAADLLAVWRPRLLRRMEALGMLKDNDE